MARMTEQEAWELDDLVTRTEIELGPDGTGFLSQREARLMGLDNLSVNYLMAKADEEPRCKQRGSSLDRKFIILPGYIS
jgi:hypothetical protein